MSESAQNFLNDFGTDRRTLPLFLGGGTVIDRVHASGQYRLNVEWRTDFGMVELRCLDDIYLIARHDSRVRYSIIAYSFKLKADTSSYNMSSFMRSQPPSCVDNKFTPLA